VVVLPDPRLVGALSSVAIRQPGCGPLGPAAREYSIPLFADDTAALMKGLGLSSAHVLGISMGGYIAQELKEMIPQSRLEFFPDGNSAPQA